MSVHKRDTRYVVRWREGSRNRSRTFDRRSDAIKFDAEARRRSQLGLIVASPTKLTLEDWIAEWLAGKRDVEPETRADYMRLLGAHVTPYLGHLPLSALEPRGLDRWQTERLDAGAGPAALGKAGALLKTILGKAAKYDLIPRNPAAFLERPRQHKRTPTPATPEQIEAMRRYLLHGPRAESYGLHEGRTTRPLRKRPRRSSPLAAWKPRQGDACLISLLGYVGLRPGEALALTWEDFRPNGLSITKTNRSGRIKQRTKTGKTRLAPIPAPVRRELVEWQIATDHNPLLFPRRRGGGLWSQMSYDHWTEHYFRPARDAAGLPADFVVYDLRHSAASLMLAEGVPLLEVAERLGHSAATCLETYAHVIAAFKGQGPINVEERIEEARAA